MSEFSKLVSKLVTPAMRARGYRKHGQTDPATLHGSAAYRREHLEMRLILAFHPYDHPEIGIRVETLRDGTILFNRLYPPVAGGIEAILQNILTDIESGVADAEPNAAPDSGRR